MELRLCDTSTLDLNDEVDDHTDDDSASRLLTLLSSARAIRSAFLYASRCALPRDLGWK